MITIIHGDDIVASRNYFLEQKQKTLNPIAFEGESISLTDLVQIFEGNTLFGEEKRIFIEDFLSKRKESSDRKDIITYLQKTPKFVDVFLWEGKQLLKKQIDTFVNAQVKTYTVPKLLFTFLDSIKPGNGRKLIILANDVVKTVELELLFFMIVRQIRLLLAISNPSKSAIDEVAKLAPWQKKKLELQAASFSLEKLKTLYKKLYDIDLAIKTGKTSLPQQAAVDFFLLEI